MTNEKDANEIHNLFLEYHYADDLGVIKSKLAEYVATVRAQERKQAFGDAQGMMEAPAPGTMASTDFHEGFEAMRRLAKQILERAVLQAAGTENRKGEG